MLCPHRTGCTIERLEQREPRSLWHEAKRSYDAEAESSGDGQAARIACAIFAGTGAISTKAGHGSRYLLELTQSIAADRDAFVSLTKPLRWKPRGASRDWAGKNWRGLSVRVH